VNRAGNESGVAGHDGDVANSLDVDGPPPGGAAFDWLGEILAATRPALHAYAVRRVGPDHADDVTGEVFAVAWRRRADCPPAAARLWLFGIARRVVANAERARRRRDRLEQRIAGQPRPPTSTGDDELATRLVVRAVVAELPEHLREAVRLVWWDDFSIAEAAQITGCSAATFRVRLFRARRRLATALAVAFAEEPAGPALLPKGSPP
jgi:RNA polymerase sigma-70 factor (ECF subfamily)